MARADRRDGPRASRPRSRRSRLDAVTGLAILVCLGSAVGLSGCAAPTLSDQQELIQRDPRRQARFAEGPPRRVFLITVAGLRPADYLDPFGHAAAEGALVHMPVLGRLANEGTMALAATPPSPGSMRASHATLLTGALPPRHGVVGDTLLSGEAARAQPFIDHAQIEAVTLFDAALGRGVVSLDWPTTGGARIELLLPERDPSVGGHWAAAVRNQASPVVARMLESIETEGREALKGADGDRSPASWPNPEEADAARVEIACRLVASERDAGLWLLRLDQTASLAASDGAYSVAFDDGLAKIDREIGRLVDCLAESGQLAETAIFVSGDVAYHPVHTSFSPNVALVRAGLIGRDPRSEMGVRSWLAIAMSHGRSAYVYARDAANALDARRVLKVEAERSGAFDLVPASSLAKAGGDPHAWFGLVARPGYALGEHLVEPSLRASPERSVPGVLRTGPSADVDAEVGFVAWGRGVRSSVQMTTLDLVDVAPTIASLLGLRLDDDIQGRAVLGLLRAAVAPPPAGPRRIGDGRALDSRLQEMRAGQTLRRSERSESEASQDDAGGAQRNVR